MSKIIEKLAACENFRSYDFNKTKEYKAGPWDDEPDKVQWIDPETGFDCLIVRNHFGALCGYAGVPQEHPLYGKGYDEAYDAIWREGNGEGVHGGLTFAAPCSPSEDESGICHVPAEGRPDHVWWFGFDCNHAFDFAPWMYTFELQHMPDLARGPGPEIVYRDLEYVVNEIESLAKQLQGVKV